MHPSCFIILGILACSVSVSNANSLRQFTLWLGRQCPSPAEQLSRQQQLSIIQDFDSASRCSMLCVMTTGCRSVCLQPLQPGVSGKEDDCLLFEMSKFISSTSVQTLDCSTNYPRGCFITHDFLPMVSCEQSSVEYSATCNYAMDGLLIQTFFNLINNVRVPRCTHTLKTNNNWWRATLANRALVTSITLYNRWDCCADRLDNFYITIDGQKCVDFSLNGSQPFAVRSFDCYKVGTTLQLTIPSYGELTLCEVQAWGFVTND